MNGAVVIGGICLRTTPGRIEVLVQYRGGWRVAIDVPAGDNIYQLADDTAIVWAPKGEIAPPELEPPPEPEGLMSEVIRAVRGRGQSE